MIQTLQSACKGVTHILVVQQLLNLLQRPPLRLNFSICESRPDATTPRGWDKIMCRYIGRIDPVVGFQQDFIADFPIVV